MDFNPVVNKIQVYSAKRNHNPKISFLSIRAIWEDPRAASLLNRRAQELADA
jgi:hypothetical protein